MQRLFIYGTLAPGRSNHHVVEDIPGSWESATLKGTLIEEGWGAAMGCPGILPGDDGEPVEGFVLSSLHLDEHWSRLDDFEGPGYVRVSVSVQVNGAEHVDAFVYAIRQE